MRLVTLEYLCSTCEQSVFITMPRRAARAVQTEQPCLLCGDGRMKLVGTRSR